MTTRTRATRLACNTLSLIRDRSGCDCPRSSLTASARGEDRTARVTEGDADRLLVVRRDYARPRRASEDLGDEAFEIDAGKQVKAAVERREERIVMGRDDQL